MNDLFKIGKYWAIEPDYLKAISKESLSTRSEKPLNNSRSVSIRDGTAIIPIHGVITARTTLFSLFAGGTSLENLAKDFNEALNSNEVTSILLDIDSPGGVAVGPFEMAEMIFKGRSKKPIYSYIGRNGSSAAYWLASATEKIFVNPSALVGSIGVVTTIPVQEQPDMDGYKNIEIVSSNANLKRPDPKTKEGLAEIRRELDDLESTFIESIAKYRSITPEIIKADFGGGGVVIGKEAVKRNMADALGTYEEVLGLLNQQNQSITINNQIMSKEQNKEINAGISKKEITADYIKKEFPDVTKAIIQEVSEDIKKSAFNEGIEAGKKQERDRILAIEATALPGHEDLIEEAKKDGSITAEKLALKIIAAEKNKASDYLANTKKAEAEIPKIEPNIDKSDTGEKQIPKDAPLETRSKSIWESNAKIRAEFGEDFDAYFAFAKANESGQVRILSNNK
jgi:ClpP class serine protease